MLLKFVFKRSSLSCIFPTSNICFQENIASSEDTGKDYEECLILSRKCAEFEQEVQVESQQIAELVTLANKLISVGQTGVENVRDRQQKLSQRWQRLKELTVERKGNLARVLRVFSFLKSCDELLDNINEKVYTCLSFFFSEPVLLCQEKYFYWITYQFYTTK